MEAVPMPALPPPPPTTYDGEAKEALGLQFV